LNERTQDWQGGLTTWNGSCFEMGEVLLQYRRVKKY
jgi:hypothetical protein